jgi:DNA-binding transcriptional LysR family regulator
VRYCASPAYLQRHGTPRRPNELRAHACILVGSGDAPVRWPFRARGTLSLVPVAGRLRFDSFALAHAAARAGLGVALFPAFACADDLRRGRLLEVLEPVEVGAIWLCHPTARALAASVRAFVELARTHLEAA